MRAPASGVAYPPDHNTPQKSGGVPISVENGDLHAMATNFGTADPREAKAQEEESRRFRDGRE